MYDPIKKVAMRNYDPIKNVAMRDVWPNHECGHEMYDPIRNVAMKDVWSNQECGHERCMIQSGMWPWKMYDPIKNVAMKDVWSNQECGHERCMIQSGMWPWECVGWRTAWSRSNIWRRSFILTVAGESARSKWMLKLPKMRRLPFNWLQNSSMAGNWSKNIDSVSLFFLLGGGGGGGGGGGVRRYRQRTWIEHWETDSFRCISSNAV